MYDIFNRINKIKDDLQDSRPESSLIPPKLLLFPKVKNNDSSKRSKNLIDSKTSIESETKEKQRDREEEQKQKQLIELKNEEDRFIRMGIEVLRYFQNDDEHSEIEAIFDCLFQNISKQGDIDPSREFGEKELI